jgi:hypothetical protein
MELARRGPNSATGSGSDHGLGRRQRRRQQRLHGHTFVSQLVHKGRVGAVFQQPAHQVGQQVAVFTHRGVDAAGNAAVLQHLAVYAFAHAVQALQLKGRAFHARHLHDGGNGAGVVAGKLRVDHVVVAEQPCRTGQVGDVGVALVREHRVTRQAPFLRAFDFTVPVGALDQPHHQLDAVAARQGRHFVHQFQAAGLVGLQRQSQAVPLRKALRHTFGQRLQQVQRQLQPLAFFGVDGQVDVGRRGCLHQRPHTRQQFGKHPLALAVFVAGKQRAELDRDLVAVLRPGAGIGGAGGNHRNRTLVGCQVLGRRRFGARTFTQHVKAEAQARRLLALAIGFGNGVTDGAGVDKLPPQQLDGAHRGRHHRLGAQALHQSGFTAGFGQEALGQGNGTGRQAGQHLVRALAATGLEVGAAQLVGRQRHRRFGVGHTQQGFGQAHQGQAFGAGDGVLAQQRLHGPEGRRRGTRTLHPGPCGSHHGRPVQPALQHGQ